jgi:hypothetical protein
MPLVEISPIRFGTIAPTCELRSPLEASYAATADVSPLSRSDVSRTSNLSLSAYLRTSQGLVGQDNMGNDLLIGRLDLTPVLDAHVCRFLIVTVRAT